MAFNAIDGSVSQVSLLNSHSFAPREPYSYTNSLKASRNLATSSESDFLSSSNKESECESKISEIIWEPLTKRDISHIANDGAAESISPRLDKRRTGMLGSPIASPTAASIPGAIPDEPAETI